MKRIGTASIIFALVLALPAYAASFDDPDWPCIQAKVPELSIGQMWAGPEVTDAIQEQARDNELDAVIGPMVVRRNSMEDVEQMIGDYAATLEDDQDAKMTALFLAVFNQISKERSQIIGGIARYAHKQTGLSELIESKRQELVALNAASDDEKNWDRIEELEDTLVWDERIYKDRQQSLTYVCETPVLMEQRVFGIARSIAGHLE